MHTIVNMHGGMPRKVKADANVNNIMHMIVDNNDIMHKN